MFSPDGRWIAYTSLESGPPQVYVRPAAAGAGGKWLISTGGGYGPRWASGGRELFYRVQGGKVMVVAIEPGPAFRAGTPKELFTYMSFVVPGLSGSYDVSADGKRFLMITSGAVEQGAATPEVHFVLEWFEDIRRRVRAGGGEGKSMAGETLESPAYQPKRRARASIFSSKNEPEGRGVVRGARAPF